MSDIYEAKPGDIFVDKVGVLWRVDGTWSEPTVIMTRIEKTASIDEAYELHGGVGGLMWNGFKRIYRPETGVDRKEALGEK